MATKTSPPSSATQAIINSLYMSNLTVPKDPLQMKVQTIHPQKTNSKMEQQKYFINQLDNIKIPKHAQSINDAIYQYISSLSTNSDKHNSRHKEYEILKYICNEVLGDGTLNEVKLKLFKERNEKAEYCKKQLLKISNKVNTDQ